MFKPLFMSFLGAFMVLAWPARAEEGMWTFDKFPLARVNKTYGLKLDQVWLDHVRDTTVRLSAGCSASVVSPQGLVFTNQHCVMACAQALSSAERDYVKDGFLAVKDEPRCEGLAAETLISVTDVTRAVRAAIQDNDFVHDLGVKASELEMAACGNDIRLHCQVVSLYQGAQYKLYKFRKYSDVHLVFVPEFSVAFFGGDPDNFNFPRYALDVAFLRIYEDGKPVATPKYLVWNNREPKAGEPVFSAGNPGKTERYLTAAQLETQRDVYLPMAMVNLAELRGRLIGFAAQGPEFERISQDALFDVENGFKAVSGMEESLRDPSFFAARSAQDGALKGRSRGAFGDPWADLGAVKERFRGAFVPYYTLEQSLNQSHLFMYARLLVRAAVEREKPSSERLPEYTDSRLPWVEHEVLTPTPIEKPLETLYLEFQLSKAREYLTTDSATTQLLLGKASPQKLGQALVAQTRLDDVEERRRLWEGGLQAIATSDDPMIQYALRIDDAARAVRRDFEDRVLNPTKVANEKIARARFRVYGTSLAPDATFTPRLSVGRVAGWTESGVKVGPFTRLDGMFARATGQAPYAVPDRFLAARDRIVGATVYNFTTSNDIAGGSSGSPVIDARGELIGVVFDGNLHFLGGPYRYDARTNRSIAVSTAAVSETLETVYGASALLKELNAD